MSVNSEIISDEPLERLEARRDNALRNFSRLNAEHRKLDRKRQTQYRTEVEHDMVQWSRQIDILDRAIEVKRLAMGVPVEGDLFRNNAVLPG